MAGEPDCSAPGRDPLKALGRPPCQGSAGPQVRGQWRQLVVDEEGEEEEQGGGEEVMAMEAMLDPSGCHHSRGGNLRQLGLQDQVQQGEGEEQHRSFWIDQMCARLEVWRKENPLPWSFTASKVTCGCLAQMWA